MGIRQNQKTLSPAMRSRFVNALKRMKTDGVYDVYVRWHVEAMGDMGPNSPNFAHQGPVFLPWHRQFLILFEEDLQKADRANGADGSITLPYWDWTVDQSPDPAENPLWADDLLGPTGDPNQGFRVTSGPFATDTTQGHENWVLHVHDPMDDQPVDFLQRGVGSDPQVDNLPTADDVRNALQVPVYDSSPWNTRVVGTKSFRNLLEGWVTIKPTGREPGLHNRVHVWIGGSMLPMSSPNDPIFFLNHCNVDRIWAAWQTAHQQADQYPPTQGAPEGHNRGDLMQPFDGRADARPGGTTLPKVTPADLLDLTKLGYSYDTLAF